MTPSQDVITMLESSLRTRRDTLGPTRLGVTRETLRRFTASASSSRDDASQAQAIFLSGNVKASLLFVGEEDAEHIRLPFTSAAGELLAKIIKAMGLSGADVAMVSILKSPAPTVETTRSYLPDLQRQIALVSPHVVVALGKTAMLGLTGTEEPMKALRGRWNTFEGIPLLPTYHPSYLLHNSALSEKRKVWEDMLLVMEKLQLPISKKQQEYFRAAH